MKRILVALAMSVAALTAFAEPTFDQMQDLIAQKNFAAAEQGLEVIIQAHPNSAKAFYSMAQAQAGLGHLDKAQYALNKAKGLDPTLRFASASNVEALQVAITPQAAKIQKVESGINWIVVLLTIFAFGIVGWIAYVLFRKEKPTEPNFGGSVDEPSPTPPAPEAVRTIKPAPMRVGVPDEYDPVTSPVRTYRPRQSAPAPAPAYSAPVPQPTVINNHYGSNSGSNDLLTGVLIGEALSGPRHSTTYVEREVIVERPAPARETYTPPARSSSWDNDSSSKSSSRSSSWDDDSSSRSSSSSSSWDSGSSSSSSSSWDSGSSSSSDSSSGSSDW